MPSPPFLKRRTQLIGSRVQSAQADRHLAHVVVTWHARNGHLQALVKGQLGLLRPLDRRRAVPADELVQAGLEVLVRALQGMRPL